MKENTGAEANAALAEAEGLICDDNGPVDVGTFGLVANWVNVLKPTWTGARLS